MRLVCGVERRFVLFVASWFNSFAYAAPIDFRFRKLISRLSNGSR